MIEVCPQEYREINIYAFSILLQIHKDFIKSFEDGTMKVLINSCWNECLHGCTT
jgi:hypothetical protein